MAKNVIYKDGKDTGEAVGPDEGWLPWAGRQGAIGLVDTPGSFATLYGLGAAGAKYLWERKGGPTDTEGNPVGSSFQEHMLDPEGGKEKLAQYDQGVMNSLRQSYPDLPPEEIQKKFEHVTKHSKKYFEETTPFYRPGISFGRKWGVGTMEALGDPRIPSERTQADTLMNIAGGAVPVPGAPVLRAITGGVGSVAGRTAGKIASNVAEVTTPVTLIPSGATTGQAAARVGANVAIPAAVDQAVRTYKDDPSVMGDAIAGVKNFYTKDDGSAEVERVGATGIVGTILAGLAARRLHNVVSPKITPPSAGPSSSTMTQAVSPTAPEASMGAARMGSDVEPFKVMGKHAGVEADELEAYMTNFNRNAGGMPLADHQVWSQQKVAPVMEQLVREDPSFVNKLWQHVSDSDRNWGDTEAIARTDKLFTDALSDLQKAQASGRSTPARIAELQRKVGDLQTERQARMADSDPNLRYSAMTDDRATVQARLQQSRADPQIRAWEAQAHKLYDDIFDTAVQDRTMSLAEANRAKLQVRAGNYHLTDNPLAQKTWLQRQGHKLAEKTANPHLVLTDPSAVLSLYRSANMQRVRKGYINTKGESRFTPAPGFTPHPRVNNPRDPLSELNHLSVRVRQAGAHNRAMHDYTTMMLNARGNQNRKLLDIVERIPEAKIPANISRIEKIIADSGKGKGPYKYAYRGENGELILVQHNEKHIHEALKFAPAAVVPLLNQTRKSIQAWTTGQYNPGFGLSVSVPFDILAGTFLRHKNMSAFGPMSYMAARTFGMGHPITRILNAFTSGPEAIINLFASYPYYAVKGIIQEFFGNQLAKRWQADLAGGSGTIGMLGKLPGGQALIGTIANAMAKGYETSWTNLTKVYKTGHVANYSDEILSRMRNIDAITKKRPELRAAGNMYKDIFTIILDVPKTMALSQNIPLFRREVRKGKLHSKQMSEAFFADQARIIGGDMARISGHPAIQKFVSVMPWSNPGIQSVRYLKQRLQENPVENFARLGSLGLVATWAYSQIGEDKEANDWFHNQLPNEQRTQSIPLPDPYRYMLRMSGVHVPRGTPEQEFFLTRINPEMMLFVLPMMHGARALGLIPGGKDVVVPQSIWDDMKHARDQIFGLATPPPVAAVAAAFGKKFEAGKILSLENPFRDIRDFNFSGANKDKMSPQSRIPHAAHDVINALYGTVMGGILEAANYGDLHANAPGGTLEKGVVEGTKKFLTTQATKAPLVNHIWPDVNRRYIYTPISEKRQKDMAVLKNSVEAQMPAEGALRRALQPNAKPNTLEKTDVAPGAVVGSPVADPNVRALMGHVHVAFFSGPYLKLEEQRRIERARHEAMTIGADPTRKESPLQRYKMAQEQAKKVTALDRQLYTIYTDQWKIMKTSPNGKAFEQKYGPLTPENLAKAIQESSRQQGQQVPR